MKGSVRSDRLKLKWVSQVIGDRQWRKRRPGALGEHLGFALDISTNRFFLGFNSNGGWLATEGKSVIMASPGGNGASWRVARTGISWEIVSWHKDRVRVQFPG